MSILIGGALLLIPLESWVHRQLAGVADALAEHLYLPMARTLLIVAFLYAIYPMPLLGPAALLESATNALPRPALSSLFNLMFFAGLALPALPAMQRFSALILPIQTLIGAWLLLKSYEQYYSAELVLLHSETAFGLMIILALICHFFLRWAAGALCSRYRWDPLTSYDSLALIMQPWLALCVTRALVLKTL